jgi:hypothetical protein
MVLPDHAGLNAIRAQDLSVQDDAPRRALAMTSLLLGIVALVMCLLPVLPLLPGIPAVILGVIAVRRSQGPVMAIVGASLGGVGILVSVVFTILLALYVVGHMVSHTV